MISKKAKSKDPVSANFPYLFAKTPSCPWSPFFMNPFSHQAESLYCLFIKDFILKPAILHLSPGG